LLNTEVKCATVENGCITVKCNFVNMCIVVVSQQHLVGIVKLQPVLLLFGYTQLTTNDFFLQIHLNSELKVN